MTIFTSEQHDIITAKNRIVLIEAVAGAGKTTTLAECVSYALREKLDPKKTLVLVFTDTAKRVFQNYLFKAGARHAIRVVTYSEYAEELLKGWQKKGIIDPITTFLSTPEDILPWIFKAIEHAAASPRRDPDYYFDLTNLHAETIINQLSWLKGTLNLRRLEEESDDTIAESLELPRGLISICRSYEKLRSYEVGQYNFQSEPDLLFDVLNIIHLYPALELPHYHLVVADEWHDANAGHMELLGRLAQEPTTRVIVSGDKEQVIHSWNGADPRFMGELFQEKFPGVSICRMPLTVSFRCGPTLGAAAQLLNGQKFSSHRSEDTHISVISYARDSVFECANTLVSAINNVRQKQKTIKLSDCVVLLRDPHQSITIENACIHNNIPYAIKGFSTYFNRLEIRMLRGILHILTGSMATVSDSSEAKAIVRALGTYTGLGYSEKEWREAEQDIIEQHDGIQIFHENRLIKVHPSEKNPGFAKREWREKLGRVCQFLQSKITEWNAGELLKYAIDHLNISDTTRRLFVQKNEATAVIKSIGSFLDFAEQLKLNAPEFLTWLDQQAHNAIGSPKENIDRLTISTIGHAKGNEWKCVFMPYLDSMEFPKPEADFAEERRLFYVAITRAKDFLVLLYPEKPSEKQSEKTSALSSASCFIERIELAKAKIIGASTLHQNKFPEKQMSSRLYFDVPHNETDEAKRMGARWDRVQRKFWILEAEAVLPKNRFSKWLGNR